MHEWQYQEIIEYLKDWVKGEGLCRFCGISRACDWSRRGRQECGIYRFANEMDCFHLWIACFDGGPRFREGYKYPDDYPWKNDCTERDIPPSTDMMAESEHESKYRMLSRRKYLLMQEIQDKSEELDIIVKELKGLSK